MVHKLVRKLELNENKNNKKEPDTFSDKNDF